MSSILTFSNSNKGPFATVRQRSIALVAGLAILILLVWLTQPRILELLTLRTARELLRLTSVEQAGIALKMLEGAAEGISEEPEFWFLKARALRRTGRFDEAMDALKQAESLGWDSTQIHQQRQLAFFQRGKIDDGGGSVDRLLMQNSSDELAYEVYESLARGYMVSYRFADALHCLDFWCDWCREATDPRLWRAAIREQTGQWDQAAAEYRDVIRLSPENLPARLSLGHILLNTKNLPEDARPLFEQCLQIDPLNVIAQIGLAACDRHQARPEDAESRLRSLLKQSLSDVEMSSVRQELGQVLLDRRALPEAIEQLRQVVEFNPRNSAAHYSLGIAFAAQGDQRTAQIHFDRSQELTNQVARLAEITSELLNHPENADLRWEAGQALMEQGLPAEGAAWMATALIYDPSHQRTHASLADYYEHVRPDPELAKSHREKAGVLK